MSYFNIHGFTSTNNSTTTPLSSAATYTGTGEQNDFPQVGVMLKTDNTGTLYFDFSNDGTNWDSTFPVNGFEVASGISEFHTAVKLGRYFRVRLVNDTGAQSYLRLTTYFGMNFTPSVAPINQSLGTDHDAQVVRPTIAQDEIVRGLRGGARPFTKFGYNADVDSGAAEVVWANGAAFTPLTSAETFTITYTPASDGSTSNGAKTLYFDYIDSNGLYATATHTLGSGGSDTTSFSGLGINRIAVSSSGSTQTNGADITITATTATTQQAIIPAGGGVTQQCIFFVDANSYGVGKFLWFNAVKLAAGGGNPTVTLKGWVWNRAIATKFEVFRGTLDVQVQNAMEISELVGFRFSPTDVFWLEAETDTNNTVVNARFSLVEYKIT